VGNHQSTTPCPQEGIGVRRFKVRENPAERAIGQGERGDGGVKQVDTLSIKVEVDLSLWSAIKLRIAGVHFLDKHHKVTIQELIDKDRE
jgi:hypothetical protein